MTFPEDALIEIAILRAQLAEAEQEREEARQDAAFQCLRAADKDCVIARLEADLAAAERDRDGWQKEHKSYKAAASESYSELMNDVAELIARAERAETERDAQSQSASHWLGKAHEQQKRAWKAEADLAAARDKLENIINGFDMGWDLDGVLFKARAFLERTGGNDG